MASFFSQARDSGWNNCLRNCTMFPSVNWPSQINVIISPRGSHDSCTYDLQDDFFSPDASGFSKVTDIIRNYAKCQDLSISAQLQAGIRYFDFIVAFREKDDDFYFCHTLYGPKVSDVLKDVRQFLDQHEQEVVLLDFNHFYAMNDKHDRLRVIAEERLSDKIYHRSDNTKAGDLTLRKMLNAKNQVIVFYTDMPLQERFQFWPSPKYTWANTMDVKKKCLKTLTEKAKNRDKTDFYVSQDVLTPGGGTIALHLLSSVRDQCAGKINPCLKEWMQQRFKKAQDAG